MTHNEVCELTGAKTKAGQIRVLTRNGIRHTIKANGWPCVIAAALLAPTIAPSNQQEGWQPNVLR